MRDLWLWCDVAGVAMLLGFFGLAAAAKGWRTYVLGATGFVASLVCAVLLPLYVLSLTP